VTFKELLEARYKLTAKLIADLRKSQGILGSDEHLMEFINKAELEMAEKSQR